MKRNTSVNIRMTEELREDLQRLADANKRTLSDYVRLLLEEHVEAQKEQDEVGADRSPHAAPARSRR
jgi:predicted DNA-binding protein